MTTSADLARPDLAAADPTSEPAPAGLRRPPGYRAREGTCDP